MTNSELNRLGRALAPHSDSSTAISYVVYYKKDFSWMPEAGKTPNRDTHKCLLLVNAEDLEDVYERMQGHNWSANGEARDFIRAKRLKHTSISIGDIVEDLLEEKFYICEPFGWKEIEAKL